MTFARIDDALSAFRRGELLVVVDDASRENEGDLIVAAEKATPDALAFMVRHTTGIICTAITRERADALELPLMVQQNTDAHQTAFTVSVDLRNGTSTGVSAHDRSATIRALIEPRTKPSDFTRPGHVFPLRAAPHGVLRRPGHTEAAVDLARLSGLGDAGALCEIVNDDGSMARLPQLTRFAAEHGLLIVSIADLIAHRQRTETLVQRISTARLPTPYGDFTIHVYRSPVDGLEHVALVRGELGLERGPMVRVQSECVTGEVFSSARCDCGEQLDGALARIARDDCGAVIYLRGHEGRGIGLANKVRAYALQDAGRDTVDANIELGLPADAREYACAASILRDLGAAKVRLLSNNPRKAAALDRLGIEVLERLPLLVRPTAESLPYLKAKQHRFGHQLGIDTARAARSARVAIAAPDAVDQQDVVLKAHSPAFAIAMKRKRVD